MRNWHLMGMLVLAGLAPPTWAGGISVAPVRLEMASGQHSISLTVRNEGSDDQVLQVTPMHWTQQQGEDHYESDQQLVITPPLFELSPGASQIVRIGLRNPGPAPEAERAWRVYVEQVSNGVQARAGEVKLQLRIGVPLFIAPPLVKRELRWDLHHTPAGLRLAAVNAGNVHVRLDHLQITQTADSRPIFGPLYVFPGQQHELATAIVPTEKVGLLEDSDAGSQTLTLSAAAQ